MKGILIAIVAGIFTGIFGKNTYFDAKAVHLIDFGLCTMLFCIGIDLAHQNGIMSVIRKMERKVLFIPLLVIAGSFLAGVIGSIITRTKLTDGILVTMGMGWYTYTGVYLSQFDLNLGSMGFMTNVMREILAVILIPVAYKKFGQYSCVAVPGAPAMDASLPIILKCSGEDTIMIAIYSGLVLTIVVPILMPILTGIFGYQQ